MAAAFPGVPARDGGLDGLKGAEVDGGVGKHACEAGGEAAVEGAHAGLAPHLARGGHDEGVAMRAATDRLGLHAAVLVVSKMFALPRRRGLDTYNLRVSTGYTANLSLVRYAD